MELWRCIDELKRGKSVTAPVDDVCMAGYQGFEKQCTVNPVSPNDLKVGDAVLCLLQTNAVIRIVKALRGRGVNRECLIGDSKGHLTSWVPVHHIFGKVTAITA